jgi:hypothetical protein
MVAFGTQGVHASGLAFAHMAPYHKIYSRAEIERVVEYIRTSEALTIQFHEIKNQDPATFAGGPRRRGPRPATARPARQLRR